MTLYRSANPGALATSTRLRTVFAYDVASPRRSRLVRKALAAWNVAAQYSVVETWLLPRERYELAAELREALSTEEDSLIVWTTDAARRWTWNGLAVVEDRCSGAATVPALDTLRGGDYVVAYDVRDHDRLVAVHAAICGVALALQRSVYLFKGHAADAMDLAAALGRCLASDDILWLYPVARAADLWFVQGFTPPVLPTGSLWR